MAEDLTNQSDAIIAAGRRLPAEQRVRREGAIGERGRALKARHWGRKLVRVALAIFALLVAAIGAGIVLDGIGFAGVMLLALATIVVSAVLLAYPRMREPTPENVRQADLKTLAGRAELWLERERPALPAPARPLIDAIGQRLDQLSPQLATLGEADPAAHEARRLIGEHLPELIEGYRRIPDPLKREAHGGSTPEAQLVSGLQSIEREIDGMTRAIASGHLDKLATRSRYLELKYSGEGEG